MGLQLRDCERHQAGGEGRDAARRGRRRRRHARILLLHRYVVITSVSVGPYLYRDRLKGVQILLSNSQAGPGRKAKQGQ